MTSHLLQQSNLNARTDVDPWTTWLLEHLTALSNPPYTLDASHTTHLYACKSIMHLPVLKRTGVSGHPSFSIIWWLRYFDCGKVQHISAGYPGKGHKRMIDSWMRALLGKIEIDQDFSSANAKRNAYWWKWGPVINISAHRCGTKHYKSPKSFT